MSSLRNSNKFHKELKIEIIISVNSKVDIIMIEYLGIGIMQFIQLYSASVE